MATCKELNDNQQTGNDGNSPEIESICGTAKIVCIENDFGIIRSLPNKDMIYFKEKHYLPPTKDILQVLKRKDSLCFVARPNRGHKKIKWMAVSVWKPGYEPGSHVKPKHSKARTVKQNKEVRVNQDMDAEAVTFLRSILMSTLSLNIKDLPAIVDRESPVVREIFLDEEKTLTFLKCYPSIFHFSNADNSLKLIDETVHNVIGYVADVLSDRGRLELASVRTAVSEHADETIASYGRKNPQLRSFLRRFTDVFCLTKEGDQWFVALNSDVYSDLDDNESMVSFTSQTTFDSTDFRRPSTSASLLSLSESSSLQTSTSDLSVATSDKDQGISKMLNALLKKEPMPVKNLIGYIHTSPPKVRQAIGNTMETLTNFLQNDENFFLQKPENQVFIRTTVEKRVLKYLSELISTHKEGKVKLDDVLKFQGKYALSEVKAFLGRSVSEVSLAVKQMIAKEELMSKCLLVLKDDVLSIEFSSQRFAFPTDPGNVCPLNEDRNKPTTSFTDPDLDNSENQAVGFLRNLLERDEILTLANFKAYLLQAPAKISAILANEEQINSFLQRHPSVFKRSGPLNVIELVNDAVLVAIEFCLNVLNMKGDLRLDSLSGHLSQASLRIRCAIDGTAGKLEGFLRQYFDVFRVYEGKQGVMTSSKLMKRTSSRPTATVTEALADRADGSASAKGTVLTFPEIAKTEFSKDKTVSQCFEGARAAKNSQNDSTREKPNPKVTVKDTSAGLDFLTGLLKMHSTMILKDIIQHVSQASKEIQEELGCSEQQIVEFLEENPAVFKISGCECCVELISETCGDAIEFFLDVLNKRGPTPVCKLHGHLSQASSTIRNATGGSPESVKAFLLQFPNVFKSYADNGIEIIASLYEGEHIRESSDTSDNENTDVSGANTKSNSKPIEILDTTSTHSIDLLDLDFATNLSERFPKAFETTAGSIHERLDFDIPPTTSEGSCRSYDNVASAGFNRLDQLDFDYIHSMSEANQIQGHQVSGETRMKPDEIEDSNESTSSHSMSENCESVVPELKASTSTRAVRVDIATETHPCSAGSSLQSPPFPFQQSVADDLTNPQSADVASVPSLVKCVKDEHNVISDLCLQALSNNNGQAVKLARLLTICQSADPLRSGWQYSLNLKYLIEIIRNDGRFFVNESTGNVMLVRDVEYMAAAFLRRCILFHGPIVLENLSSYSYLSSASAEVQVLLGTSSQLAQFRKKSIKLLWPKYRDQLVVQNGVLIVPQDAESDSLGFLSNLIETYGPLRIDSLLEYLPHASSAVNKFLKGKVGSIEEYLQENWLDKQFIVWNRFVDLVRSGNLQKNRLIVEQTVASFLINTVHFCGPVSWNQVKKPLSLKKATPEVREFLGGQWNATSVKQSRLKKFCSERPDLFILRSDGIHVSQISDACPTDTLPCTNRQSQETEQRAVQFLKNIIAGQGAIGCKQKKLACRFDLIDAPSDIRVLLGGRSDATRFDKKLLKMFSLCHPTVFTTYKRSIDLKESVYRPQPTIVGTEPHQIPVQNQQENRNPAAEVAQLQQSLDSTVVTQLPSETPLSMPSDLPFCFPHSNSPVNTVASFVSCLPPTTSTASYPTMLYSELNNSSLVTSLVPQMAYLPLSQVPLAQYLYEPALGLPLNLDLASSASVQPFLQPTGLEALPQIDVSPEGTSPLIASSFPSAIQGDMVSYAPGVFASQFTAPTVKPLGHLSTSHIVPLARVSPSWRQSIPVETEESLESVQPSVDVRDHAPHHDALYSLQTQQIGIEVPLTSTSTQPIDIVITQPLFGNLESAMSDFTVTHDVQPFYGTSEGAIVDSTVTHGIQPFYGTSEGPIVDLTVTPHGTQPFYGTSEGAVVDSTVTHGIQPFYGTSEGAVVDSTVIHGTHPLYGTSEGAVVDSTVIHGTHPLYGTSEGAVVDSTVIHGTQPLYCTLESAMLDSTVIDGLMKVMTAEDEGLEKHEEKENPEDLEVQRQAPDQRNSPEVMEEVTKMESQEGIEESLMGISLAQVKDTETSTEFGNKEKLLLAVPQLVETSEIAQELSKTLANSIRTKNDAATEFISDNSCTSAKSDSTLRTDDAMVLSSSAETEVSELDAGSSKPCVESSLKFLKGNDVSPITWKSLAQSTELPDFNEQFGQSFDGVAEYLSFVDGEARREDSSSSVEYQGDTSATGSELYETAESDVDSLGEDFEEVTGTVLSAVGNEVYVKRDDDQVVRFTPENCSRHFIQCCNLGRHFAVGESVSLRYKKFPRELVAARSVCASTADDEELGTCCSNLHINLGHGRVALTGKNYVVFVMSNQEMAGFITVNPHLFSPNDLIAFWSTKVSGFVAPWRSHSVTFTNQDGVTIASKSDPHSMVDRISDSSPWRLTTEVCCQTDLTMIGMQTSADNHPVNVVSHKNAQTLSTGRIMSCGYYPDQ